MRDAFFLLVILIVLAGCHPPKPLSDTSGVNNIVIELWASSNCVQPGDTLKLRATATNRGTVTFRSDMKVKSVLDLVVKADDKITRWSDNKTLTGDVTKLELKPGQSKTIEMDYRVQCCANLQVSTPFIYDPEFPDPPRAAYVFVSVHSCPSMFGP